MSPPESASRSLAPAASRPAPRRRRAVALVTAVALAAPAALAAPPPGPRASAPAGARRSAPAARPSGPAPSLGAHASLLEGTWEFRSLTREGAAALVPPAASGVIVIDRGVVLAASYVQASPQRKVGSVWEGRMALGDATYDVIPEKGFRYDSATDPPVTPALPPRTSGRLERLEGGGIRLWREDGGTITFEPAGRRVQVDADGTTIVHERTSLTPRIPEDLPGR